jgi:hypothetical protein
MREYAAVFMGAVFEGSLIVCASVSGIVVFSELEPLEWYQIVIYCSALTGIVIGILTVAYACFREEMAKEEAREITSESANDDKSDPSSSAGALSREKDISGDTMDQKVERNITKSSDMTNESAGTSTHHSSRSGFSSMSHASSELLAAVVTKRSQFSAAENFIMPGATVCIVMDQVAPRTVSGSWNSAGSRIPTETMGKECKDRA